MKGNNDAEGTGEQVEERGEGEGIKRETERCVCVWDDAKDGMETEKGKEVVGRAPMGAARRLESRRKAVKGSSLHDCAYADVLAWTLRHYHAIMQIGVGSWARGPETKRVVREMGKELLALHRKWSKY